MKVLIDAKIASIPYPCTFIFWLFGHNFPLISPLYDYTFVDIKFSNSHRIIQSLYYSPASRCINAWMHSLKKPVKPEIVNRYDLWVLRHKIGGAKVFVNNVQ